MEKNVAKNIRQQPDGTWSRTVVFGDPSNYPTTIRVYYYSTRDRARRGDISDDIGKYGRVR